MFAGFFKRLNTHAISAAGATAVAAGIAGLLTKLSDPAFVLALLTSPNRTHILVATTAATIGPIIAGTVATYFGRPGTVGQAGNFSTVLADDTGATAPTPQKPKK